MVVVDRVVLKELVKLGDETGLSALSEQLRVFPHLLGSSSNGRWEKGRL